MPFLVPWIVEGLKFCHYFSDVLKMGEMHWIVLCLHFVVSVDHPFSKMNETCGGRGFCVLAKC